jgi:Chaperone of endosialidase
MKTQLIIFRIVALIILANFSVLGQSSIDEVLKPKAKPPLKSAKASAPLSDWVLSGTEIYNLSTEVGIGTSAPAYKLDIHHGGGTGLQVFSSSSFSVIDIDAASGDAALRFAKNGVNQWNFRNDPSTNNLQIFELGGGGERLNIQNSTGNLGVNDSNPAEKLSIKGRIKMDDPSKGLGKVLTSDANGVGTWQTVGTAAAGWSVLGSNIYNSGLGNVGIGTSTTNAPLQFANTLDNRKLALYEAANNDHQFYGFGINPTTLRYQVESPNASHIFYAGLTNSTSKELFRISGNGSVTVNGVFTLTSDARLKKNIKNLGNQMPKFMALNAKTYNWIDETKSAKTQIGLIAQEVEKIYPELVDTNETGYKSVNYIGLIPVLLEGIKDLQKQLDVKNKDFDQLKSDFSELKAKVENISAMISK